MIKAEILQALHIAQYNISFSSTADDNDRFKRMSPDSVMARSYRESYTKVSYMLKYGIADYLKEQLIYDAKGVPFTFMFDETTTHKNR